MLRVGREKAVRRGRRGALDGPELDVRRPGVAFEDEGARGKGMEGYEFLFEDELVKLEEDWRGGGDWSSVSE